jgi:D-glycero-D-manno-heptose 1,7-bisphosphate phosphatase
MQNPFRKEVVVLDRDGTIVVDHGYNSDPSQLKFLDDVPASMRAITAAGYRIIVITNQSGVGRGFFSREDVEAANARLLEMTAEIGSHIARIYYCPHHPNDHCLCRKPETGLMRVASKDFGFDPKQALVVGDKPSDIQFGDRAGSKTILISEALSSACRPHRTVRCFTEAARLIVDRTLWEPDDDSISSVHPFSSSR